MTFIYGKIAEIFASSEKSGSRNTIVTSDLRAEVEIWPFHACTMRPTIIIGTVHLLWTWLWGSYHVQNVFLVL